MRLHKIFILILFTFSLLLSTEGVAQSRKVQQLKKERRSIQSQIRKMEKELSLIKNNQKDKIKEVQLLHKKEEKRAQLIFVLNQEIRAMKKEIDSLSTEEEKLLEKENKGKEKYAQALQIVLQRKKGISPLLFVLSSKDFDQGVRRIRFLNEYAQAHTKSLAELKKTREELSIVRTSIKKKRQKKSSLIIFRKKEKDKLIAEQKIKHKQISHLKQQEKNLQYKKKQHQRKIARINRQIQRQIEKEIAEAKRRALAEEKRRAKHRKKGTKYNSRKASSKGGYPMTAEERALSGSFAHNKGRLPAPVDKNYRIISRFGVQAHEYLKGVKTKNNGIDIEVPKGTNARAVFQGVVSSIFVIDGNKVAIIVRHGNYLTVYSNLIHLRVKKGQKVKAHQILGKVADDSFSKKETLNFQVWHERHKLNPQKWIR